MSVLSCLGGLAYQMDLHTLPNEFVESFKWIAGVPLNLLN